MSSRTPRESQLLTTVIKRLKALALADPTLVWRKRHGSSFGTTGDPDLYGVWKGTPFAIELKRPGESPTPLQQFRLNEWSRAGAKTFVIHSLDELHRAIATLRPVV